MASKKSKEVSSGICFAFTFIVEIIYLTVKFFKSLTDN